jgi:single-strand DNA-binding protein
VADKADQELQKGSEVSIEGKLVYRNYVDKDGAKKFVAEVNVFDFTLLSIRAKNEA